MAAQRIDAIGIVTEAKKDEESKAALRLQGAMSDGEAAINAVKKAKDAMAKVEKAIAVAEAALRASEVEQSKHMAEVQAAEEARKFAEDRKRDAIVAREVRTL